ncbi:VHS [Macleaya cordata]|uniref:VHS n=1 Tax=Macleaya cordata TaxID=56857 RepID=A0A200RC96_MACCD|nr:VHS [Macleaya cordata]
MVNPFVDKATSDKLIGPDWAMNIEICDIMNRDPGQIKDVIKGLKKRLKSKTPKVQVLALTLLDTILKNCANIVLMHIVEKKIHLVLVKIGSKKSDDSVSDKLDAVLDTWHEVFGDSRPGHPKFYAPQREILRAAGAAFPKKSERSIPIYTTRTQPQTSYPTTTNPDYQKEGADSSEGSDFPTLSLTEIQNVGALIDILSDMLNALDSGDKEGLRQDVIVDLVGQSRSYKQRLVHLINTASDEVLIRQGLSLNDDLHHVLAKYETMVSETSVQVEKAEHQRDLVDVKDLTIATGDYCELRDGRCSSSTSAASQCPVQLKPPAHPASDDPIGPMIDLLSGEEYNSPKADNALALVPVNEPQATSSESQQNILALPDMFSQASSTTDSLSSESNYPAGQTYSSTLQFQNQQQMFYSNGSDNPAWNFQVTQGLNNEQQDPHYGGASQSSGALPPPPWETQPTDDSQLVGTHEPQPLQVTQVMVTHSQQALGSTHPQSTGNDNMVGMYIQPITNSQLANLHNQQIQSNQLVGIPHSTQGGQMMVILPQAIHGSQFASMNPQTMQNNQLEAYGYDQNQGVQFLSQGMHGLSMQDENAMRNYSSSQMPTYLPMNKPSSSGDNKLFGDLVDMAKLKQKNPPHGTGGSL